MDKSKKNTYIIAAISLFIIAAAVYFLFIFQKSPKEINVTEGSGFVEDIKSIEISKRPFITLTPTADGAEIIISIENMGHFNKIDFELTYLADNPQIAGEKIQRGSTGSVVNTADAKFKKSLLLGTASKGVRSPDTGISEGKLTLHLFKDDTEYNSETNWDRYEVGLASRQISDQSGKFLLNVPKLGKNYWVIIADTVGVPPNAKFEGNEAVLPVYGTFSIAPGFSTSANLSIKLEGSENNLQLYNYNVQDSTWQSLESNFQDNSLTAKVDSFATFVVVSSP